MREKVERLRILESWLSFPSFVLHLAVAKTSHSPEEPEEHTQPAFGFRIRRLLILMFMAFMQCCKKLISAVS